jgi:rubrerythrin
MTQRMEKLAEIFQEAAEAERQARLRYEEAAQLCDDPVLREVLEAMAKDEARHEMEVIARFRQIASQLGGVN